MTTRFQFVDGSTLEVPAVLADLRALAAAPGRMYLAVKPMDARPLLMFVRALLERIPDVSADVVDELTGKQATGKNMTAVLAILASAITIANDAADAIRDGDDRGGGMVPTLAPHARRLEMLASYASGVRDDLAYALAENLDVINDARVAPTRAAQ